MDHASKQTALFFGFLTAAMTAASAQAAPAVPTAAQGSAVHQAASTLGRSGPKALRPAPAARPAEGSGAPRR